MRLRLGSRAGEVPAVVERVQAFCADAGFAPAAVFEIGTCAAEAINNVIEHAYAGAPDGVVAVRCSLCAGTLVLQVVDRGAPMTADAPPAPMALDGESGRGWAILRAWSDRVHYRRRGRCNVLRIERALASGRDAP